MKKHECYEYLALNGAKGRSPGKARLLLPWFQLATLKKSN